MFITREHHEATHPVAMPTALAREAERALRYIASEVFEDEEEQRYHLQDAATAVRQAADRAALPTMTVPLTEREIAHVPAALRHAAREIFDRDDRRCRPFQELADAVEAAAPSAGHGLRR